jgi:hypothetical protein
MNLYFLGWQSSDSYPGLLRSSLHLAARPDVAAVCLYVRRAIQRLHWRMGQVWHFINSFDSLCGAGQGQLDIAFIGRDRTGFRCKVHKCFANRLAARCATRTIIDLKLQSLAAFNCGPCVIGNNGDSIRNLDYILYARHSFAFVASKK